MAAAWSVSLADKNVDVAHLHPTVRQYMDAMVDYFKQATGVEPVITSGYRSIEKQQQLYDQRSSNPYPVNRPGDSAHNYGLAFDSDVPDKWMPTWIAFRRWVGFTVPDNDEVHTEVPNWRQYVAK